MSNPMSSKYISETDKLQDRIRELENENRDLRNQLSGKEMNILVLERKLSNIHRAVIDNC